MRQHLEMRALSLSSRQPDLRRGSRTSSRPRLRRAGATLSPRPASSRLPSTLWGSGSRRPLRGQTNLAPVGPLATARTSDRRCTLRGNSFRRRRWHDHARWRGERCAGRAGARSRGASRRAQGYIAAGGRLVPRDDRAPTATVGSSDPATAQAKTETQPLLPRAPPLPPGCAAEADRAPTDSNCE